MRFYFLHIFLGLLLCSQLFATDTNKNEAIRKLVEADMEKLHLEVANVRIAQLSPAYKSFYQSNILIYKYAATQNSVYLNAFLNEFDNNIKQIQSIPTTHPHRNIFLSEMYGKRATLAFVKEDYLKAILDVKESYRLIQLNQKLFPGNSSNLKMLGLFNVLLSAVPQKYHWIINSLGFKGDLELGLKQLKSAIKEGDVLRQEASYMMYYVEKNLLAKHNDAMQRLLTEQQLTGESIALDFFLASGYFSLNQNEKAFAILSKRSKYLNDAKVFYIPYWDFLLGKCYYFKEDYTQAQNCFHRFVNNHKGNMYKTDATFRCGISYLLQGNYAAAKTEFNKIKTGKRSGFDEDEYAYGMATRFASVEPSYYTKALFRARILFDGGYFAKSLGILNGLKENMEGLSVENKAELHYRLGRIYHVQSNFTTAVFHYQASINTGNAGQSTYMQAYANYYLGEISRAQGKATEARAFYNKAISYNGYYYQNGLETKCKTALNRLK